MINFFGWSGCGIIVPDAENSEAYIQFLLVRLEWRIADITASYMLHYLHETCMSNNITLHVSAPNPAVILYEIF